jgi:hypothetical protein
MMGTRGKGEVNSATNHIGFRCVLASAMGISRTSLGAGRSVYELNSKSTSAMKLIRTRQEGINIATQSRRGCKFTVSACAASIAPLQETCRKSALVA